MWAIGLDKSGGAASRGFSLSMVSKVAVVVALAMGIGMIVLGSIFVFMGADAKDEIRASLLKERVISSKDAPIPGVLVEDSKTARAQAAAIESHTFGRFGPYSGMERDDPNREVYLNGLTLRNAFNLAAVGFGIGDMAIGLGAVTVVLGLIITALAIPVHILVMRVQRIEAKVEG